MAQPEKRSLLERIFRRRSKQITEINNSRVSQELGNQQAVSDKIIAALSTSSVALEGPISTLTADEKTLFALYDQMDQDAIISAALDLFADNATLVNQKTGHVAAVQSEDLRFQEEVNDFLWNIVKVDTEAWHFIRAAAKYGKVFLDTQTSNNSDEWAFTVVDNPALIQALSNGTSKVSYFAVLAEQDQQKQNSLAATYGFGNNKGTEYKVEPGNRYIAGFNVRKFIGSMTLKAQSAVTGETYTDTYKIVSGRSILDSVVSTWQTLTNMENAMLTNRLTKATQFKLVQVNVSNSSNAEQTEILQSVKNAFKNSETINRNSDAYQNRLAPIPVNDLIFVPVKAEKGAVTVTTHGGEAEKIAMEDIEYERNKLFAGLGVLKAYLGFEETTPGGLGDSTLTKLDERFGRRVSRLQVVLKAIITQIVEYYWVYSRSNRTLENMPSFTVVLGKVSTREDQEARSTLKDNFDIADKILSFATNQLFAEKINADKLFKYIFEEVIGIDTSKFDNAPHPSDIKLSIKDLTDILDNAKEQVDTKDEEAKQEVKESTHSKYKHNGLECTTKELLTSKNIYRLFENYDVELVNEDESQVITLSDMVQLKQFLSEATYKDLRSKSKQEDPARVSKSKKIRVRYMGVDKGMNVMFTVSAEDPEKNAKAGRPTSYKTKVLLRDAEQIFKEKQGTTTDANLVRQAINGNLLVSCTCPAATYWGQEYKGTIHDYSLVKNNIPPTRNLPTQVVCKHMFATLTALPFWNNSIVRDFRALGILSGHKKHKKSEPTLGPENKDEA